MNRRRSHAHRAPPRGQAARAVIEATVARIGSRGDGIAEGPDGYTLYIPLTVPGDRVRARIGAPRGDGRAAEVVEIISPGLERAEPPCPHFARCGGCSLQHLTGAAYAEWKLAEVRGALARAGFADSAIEPLARTAPGGRRRATFAADRPAGGGAPRLGFNAAGGHEVVDLAVCPVLAPGLVALLPCLRSLLADILAPRQRTRVAAALLDGGLDVVVDWPAALGRDPGLVLLERLAAFAEDADLARLSWRREATDPAEPIVQRRPVGADFGGTFVAVPPCGFLQASEAGETALRAAVMAAIGSARQVVDLFAGAGTFSLPLARAGARVHAVDADAPSLAALAAAARGMAGVTTQRRNLFSQPLTSFELNRFDAAVLDPPRAGARAQAEELARCTVRTVVAVSCDLATFTRDARILAAGGYRLVSVAPVDQFLWSAHLELAAVFRRDQTR